jgi:DeoR family transcriptional regulator of aga operon
MEEQYTGKRNNVSSLNQKDTSDRIDIRLAEAAADLVKPNELIILDSGTSTEALARRLRSRNIRPLIVITNGLKIALELADSCGISVILAI